MNKKDRIVSLDIGLVRIGIAISDETQIIALGLGVFKRGTLQEDSLSIQDKINEYSVSKVVIGLPINMNGTMGKNADHIIEYSKEISKLLNMPAELFDERLTTRQATQVLIKGGVRRKKRKKVVDKIAAQIILQAYLDKQCNVKKDE